jgi:hypothetical protein
VAKDKLGEKVVILQDPSSVPTIAFDLETQDAFVKAHGTKMVHYIQVASPLGLVDRGDLRRPGQLDTTAENGFIYRIAGTFTGKIMGNNTKKLPSDGGLLDSSEARLTLPRFYDTETDYANGARIFLTPGDRLYIQNPEIDMRVVANQLVEWQADKDTFLHYPALLVQMVLDSRGNEYFPHKDFSITADGNLHWTGRSTPGIDPDTKKGRILSIRYLYNAHYYVSSIINEIRIGNASVNGVKTEQRMPYHCSIVREYIFRNRQNGDQTKPIERLIQEDKSRVTESPSYDILPTHIKVQVNDGEGID